MSEFKPGAHARRPLTIVGAAFLASLVLPSVAQAAAPQSAIGNLVDYKDWEIGCDNARACVALGMTNDDGSMSAYVRLARDGAADATTEVEFVVFPPDDSNDALKQPRARLALDAHKDGGLPAGLLELTADDPLYRYRLPADAVPDFIAALRSATRITVDLFDGDRKVSTQVISLAGSSAALLQMDDAQKRIGTVTALVKKGNAGADAIPPVPALPVVTSLPVTEIAEPLPAPPKGMPKPSPDGCGEGPTPYLAYGLGEGAQLWGVCVSAGAYNFAYDFRRFVGGTGAPANFVVPGQSMDSPNELWNSYVDEGSKRLNSGFRGRGLGDCGSETEWAYDGSSFHASRYAGMGMCRGVVASDWPVLYRATVK